MLWDLEKYNLVLMSGFYEGAYALSLQSKHSCPLSHLPHPNIGFLITILENWTVRFMLGSQSQGNRMKMAGLYLELAVLFM